MSRLDTAIPVIAIDGPSGTGKGTISRIVAAKLGFHFLDSGVLYRLVGLAARVHGVSLGDEQRLVELATGLRIHFQVNDVMDDARVWLDGVDVSEAIRTSSASADASIVAAIPRVRHALLDRQRAFRQSPGIVADGRDIGTVVFPDADLKIFLTATAEERARRRHKQLLSKGTDVSFERLLADLNERDVRDSARAVAPLTAAADAVTIDTTKLTINEVTNQVLALWRAAHGDQNGQSG